MSYVRSATRFLLMLFYVPVALTDFILCGWWRKAGEGRRRWQAGWLHRHAKVALWIMGFRIRIKGRIPDPARTGIVISNHISYADIFCLSASIPVIFISHNAVKRWPLGGWLAQIAGTIFIRRLRPSDLPRVTAEMAERVADGASVALFPEGTTTDGSCLLPMTSGLLQPAAENSWPVYPVYLCYRAADSGNSKGIAWIGDAAFLPHFLGLLGLRHVDLTVRIDEPVFNTNRREILNEVRTRIQGMGGEELGLLHPLPEATQEQADQAWADSQRADAKR